MARPEPLLPRPEDIRLIVSDVDGTLLDSAHECHPRTQRAVRHLRATRPDLPFSIASGKQYNSCLHLRGPDVLNLSPDDPALHCHGCITYGKGGQIISCISLKPDVIALLINTFQDPAKAPGATFMFTVDEVYLIQSDDTQDWLSLARTYDFNVHDVREPAERDALVARVTRGEVEIVKITLGANPDHVPRILEELDRLAGDAEPKKFGSTRAVSFIIEVAPPGVDKGVALTTLCKSLNIPLSSGECLSFTKVLFEKWAVLAFGDGENDTAMLAIAGYSVAMANAMPGAIAVSKYRTLSNDEGGVGAFLERVYGTAGQAQAHY